MKFPFLKKKFELRNFNDFCMYCEDSKTDCEGFEGLAVIEVIHIILTYLNLLQDIYDSYLPKDKMIHLTRNPGFDNPLLVFAPKMKNYLISGIAR